MVKYMNCDIDTVKVNELLFNIDKELKEYDKNIALFFKELVSNTDLLGNNSSEYRNTIKNEMVDYNNYGESFKKFINTTRQSINELEAKIINNNWE